MAVELNEMITNGKTEVATVVDEKAPMVEASPLGQLNMANNELAEHLIDIINHPVLSKRLIAMINTALAPKSKVDADGNAVEDDDSEGEIRPGERLVSEIRELMNNRETASRAIVKQALRGM